MLCYIFPKVCTGWRRSDSLVINPTSLMHSPQPLLQSAGPRYKKNMASTRKNLSKKLFMGARVYKIKMSFL